MFCPIKRIINHFLTPENLPQQPKHYQNTGAIYDRQQRQDATQNTRAGSGPAPSAEDPQTAAAGRSSPEAVTAEESGHKAEPPERIRTSCRQPLPFSGPIREPQRQRAGHPDQKPQRPDQHADRIRTGNPAEDPQTAAVGILHRKHPRQRGPAIDRRPLEGIREPSALLPSNQESNKG